MGNDLVWSDFPLHVFNENITGLVIHKGTDYTASLPTPGLTLTNYALSIYTLGTGS